MNDDQDREDAGELDAILATDDALSARIGRIRQLSDDLLLHYYALLGDTRYVSNVAALTLFEDEMKRRGLPISRAH